MTTTSLPDAGDDAPAHPSLVARVEEYDDEPDVCTLHPRDPEHRLTEWVSAAAGSYVSLDEMR
ncbi:DUF7511 domain-containing protein [Halarchaeum sp. P4]|uniref:DUF7511 domain-containing protein n=1 Tax=Halarchaeum sp. P4 TaxID=3421639 RepID=UPI003EB8FC5A